MTLLSTNLAVPAPLRGHHLTHEELRKMADEPRKRSRFDQAEPDPPARKSRFDRRSRSPARRDSDNATRPSRSPTAAAKDKSNAAAAAAEAAARINASLASKKGPQHVDVPPIRSV